MERVVMDPHQLQMEILRDGENKEHVKRLYAGLTVPSYVHGYSLAVEYMLDWFENNLEKVKGKNYLVGGIYVDGKNVLDEYKKYSRNVIVGQNPRARVAPQVEFDYDREFVDLYAGTPDILIRRSDYNKSFFRDYYKDLYLGMDMQELKMTFSFKIRVNTRAQQLDLFNSMRLGFKVGATQNEYTSADFHIPKSILLNLAQKAGFDIENDEIKTPLDFLEYLNSNSDIPFLFKMRAINQKPEYFIRVNGLYTHIDIRDKLQVDDGERDGKLDFNFHVEMQAELKIPIPAFYILYSADDFKINIDLTEPKKGMMPIYTFNTAEIPKVDENGWYQAAQTECVTDDYEKYIDLNPIFTGKNGLTQALHHDMVRGISPARFMNISVRRRKEPTVCKGEMNWENLRFYIKNPTKSENLIITVYVDRSYINDLDITLRNLHNSRIESNN